VATITTTIDLDENAFTVSIDPTTGKEVISLSKDLMENYGLENVEFEQVVDETTGQTVYRMKPVLGKDGKIYELITDPTTGSRRNVNEIYFEKKKLFIRTIITSQRISNTRTINDSY
jgi:hypothetical protein